MLYSMVQYDEVLHVLSQHMQTEGKPIAWDIERSRGACLVDGVTRNDYLDLFSFFATNPIGHNHPEMIEGSAARELARIAPHNPSNSDIYTREMAEFVDRFWNTTVPEPFRHLFLISGGTLAVENALKAAFDWKVQKNFSKYQKPSTR